MRFRKTVMVDTVFQCIPWCVSLQGVGFYGMEEACTLNKRFR